MSAAVTSDMFPTVLDLLGLTSPTPDRPLDGVSLKDLIEGKPFTRAKPIGFWTYDRKREAGNEPWMDPRGLLGTTPTTKRANIQFVNFKHPTPRVKDFPGGAAWLDGNFKLLTDRGRAQLFDLGKDFRETRDLAADKPDLVRRMSAALHAWQRSVERSLSGRDYADANAQ